MPARRGDREERRVAPERERATLDLVAKSLCVERRQVVLRLDRAVALTADVALVGRRKCVPSAACLGPPPAPDPAATLPPTLVPMPAPPAIASPDVGLPAITLPPLVAPVTSLVPLPSAVPIPTVPPLPETARPLSTIPVLIR